MVARAACLVALAGLAGCVFGLAEATDHSDGVGSGSSSSASSSSSSGHATCTPGAQTACACPGGGQGAQVCNAAGTGLRACDGCPDGGASSSSSASSSSGCVPHSCVGQGVNCGTLPDGCGGSLNCGACAAPDVCGAMEPNVCGCAPRTCTQLQAGTTTPICGMFSDLCGGHIDCGGCDGGVCSGGECAG